MNFQIESLEAVTAPGKWSKAFRAVVDFGHGFIDGF